MQHVVVSFPSVSQVSDTDAAAAQRSLVYWILKFCGVSGGVVVFHHKRITKQGRHPGSQNIHYHAIVQGRVDPELVCGLYAQYGIIVRGLGRTRNARKQMEYILSHASVPVTTDTSVVRPSNPANNEKYQRFLHVAHWFGSWSYNKHQVPKLVEMIKCPGCERSFPKLDWMRVFFIGSDPPPTDEWGVIDWDLWRAVDGERWM